MPKKNTGIKKVTKYTNIKRWHIVVSVILLLILAYVLVIPFIQKSYLKHSLEKSASAEFSRTKDGLFQKNADQLKKHQETLELSEPVYSADYDMCYTDHNDSGWFANSYNYNCAVSSVSVYETKVVVGPAKPIEGLRQRKVKYIFQDEYLKLIGREVKDTPVHSFDITTESAASVDEIIEDSIVPDFVVAYAHRDARNNKKLISEKGSRNLDTNKRYVVIASGERYFNKNIGCATNSFIFCDSPLGE